MRGNRHSTTKFGFYSLEELKRYRLIADELIAGIEARVEVDFVNPFDHFCVGITGE